MKDMEYKHINFKLNEHQDGRQNPRCLSKVEPIKDFVLNNYIQFPDTSMQFSGYVGNINSFTTILRHKFHLHWKPRWRPKLKMAVGDDIMLSIISSLCTTKFLFILKCML